MCPTGFEKGSANSCYKFNSNMVAKFAKAEQLCQSLHYQAHLVEINEQQTRADVEQMAKSNTCKCNDSVSYPVYSDLCE